MKKLLKEPFVHFVMIGAGLFALYAFANKSDSSEVDHEIVVPPGRIEQLINIYERTWQRPPTSQELNGLVDDFVLEEIYYREARQMGLDADDTIIRRRLRQKLEFLTDDTSALVEPTDEQLAEYLSNHQDKFLTSPEYTFQQVYFNPDKTSEEEVRRALSYLNDGNSDVGDPSLLPGEFNVVNRFAVDGTFGIGFSESLDELEVGPWQGPVRSGLGLHLIKLTSRTGERVPELNEIRTQLQREWANDQRLEFRDRINSELLDRYTVLIQWPDGLELDNPASGKDGAP